MLWVGERTRQPDGAHAEFFAGVHNPLGAKVGPGATPEALVALCDRLNPAREPGQAHADRPHGRRARRGAPAAAAAGRARGRAPGGLDVRPDARERVQDRLGVKTRHFDAILAEIEGFFAACFEEGVWPGGVHLEYTGEDVTECLGGSEEVREDQLSHRYETLCDPRLNARQSLDLAFRVAELMRAGAPANAHESSL